MSNALGIAGVSAILQSMLQVRLSDPALAATLGGNVTVSVLPPDRVDLGNANDPNQVNLFLHQVVRNPGWANVDLPSRAGDGQRITAPPLVLDLHYLLTVFGSSQLYGEILLGECMQALHEQPVPSRATLGSSGDLHAVDAIASRWLTSASSEGPVRKEPGSSSCACHPARHRAALPFAVEHPKRGTPWSPPGMGVPLPTEGEPHARSPCEPRLAPRRRVAGWLRACPDVHSARTRRSGAVEAIALRPRAVRHGT